MTAPDSRCVLHATHRAAGIMDAVMARVAAVHRLGRQPVVLFDLDGTLFDNCPRTWQIIYEFANSHAHHALARRLSALPKLNLPYAIRHILEAAGETDAELTAQVTAFWRQRFFTDDYIRYDEPVGGAVQFVERLHLAKATVVYFSGRDSPNMLVGTTRSLRTHGFPVGVPGTVITLKEMFDRDDLEFKREAVEFLVTLGEVVATFDNEPANCNMFHARFPEAANVALATSHTPDPPQLCADLPIIADFTD